MELSSEAWGAVVSVLNEEFIFTRQTTSESLLKQLLLAAAQEYPK